ncbi:MAG TPA: PHB depolymerase family esterase [Gemmatimonadaceae bacterium]
MDRVSLSALARFVAPLLAGLVVSCGGSPGVASTGSLPNACGENFVDANCRTIEFGGDTRAYLLHVPANFQSGSGALVIALHGSRGSGLRLSETSGLSSESDRKGFAVAYPFALVSPGSGVTMWNEFFNRSFGRNPPDDVGFIRTLIQTLQAEVNPDPKRIFVTGLSNGGFMAHRVAVELSDLVAAIGVVEGTLVSPGDPARVPRPVAPVSVLILHGDQDPIVPCCSRPPVASQEQTFNYWIGPSANACSTIDTSKPICDSRGNPIAIEKNATGCRGNTEVRYYRLEGGVHHWYTGPMNIPGQSPFNPDFDAATGVTTDDILWNFFASHPKA